jgi:hypothetical protein
VSTLFQLIPSFRIKWQEIEIIKNRVGIMKKKEN